MNTRDSSLQNAINNHLKKNIFQNEQDQSSICQWKNNSFVELNKSMAKSEFESKKKLPDKLQKWKERVQRDRSETLNIRKKIEKGRDDENTLYGRSKIANEINEEFKNIQGKLRKSSNKSYGLLQKQNFKEDKYEVDKQILQNRFKSQSFERAMNLRSLNNTFLNDGVSDKENIKNNLALSNKSSIHMLQNDQSSHVNRYKRTQQKSLQTLAIYQSKYEKLEQNFKKFANNIKHANQTDQIIQSLRVKSGIQVISQILRKFDFMDTRRYFKIWKLNSGIYVKLQMNQEKVLFLVKSAQKIYQKQQNYLKILHYQKWKKICLNFQEMQIENTDKMKSILSESITNTEYFNRCVENDKYISLIFNQKLQDILGSNILLSSDLIFFEDSSEEQILKSYNDESGEEIILKLDGNGSILERVIQNHQVQIQQDPTNVPITVIGCLEQDPNYNAELDRPINIQRIKMLNISQTNAFNKVRSLSQVLISFETPIRIGVLRLFLQGVQTNSNLQSLQQLKHLKAIQKNLEISTYQYKIIKNLSEVLPQFLQRIFEVRSQINSLVISNMDQLEQLKEMENINLINQKVRELQKQLSDCTDQSQMVQIIQQEVEKALGSGVGGYEIDGFSLKQIIYQNRETRYEENLMATTNKDIIRIHDHIQENQEIIEEFIDIKKEYYTHQISICPKINNLNNSDQKNLSMSNIDINKSIQNYGNYQFIIQQNCPYQQQKEKFSQSPMIRQSNNQLNMSTLSGSLNPLAGLNSFIIQPGQQAINMASLAPKKQNIDQISRHRLSFYFKSLIPIIQQAHQISSSLFPKITQLTNQVKLQDQKSEIFISLLNFAKNNNLASEQNTFTLQMNIKIALITGLQQFQIIQAEEYQDISNLGFILINKNYFASAQNLGMQKLEGYLDQFDYQIFDQEIIQKLRDEYGSKITSKVVMIQEENQFWKKIEINENLLPQQTSRNGSLLIIPIYFQSGQNIQCTLILKASETDNERIEIFQETAQRFLDQLFEMRKNHNVLQDQLIKLEFKNQEIQMSQEIKELILYNFVIPFLKKQTLKSIGESIDFLSEKLVSDQGSQEQKGQDVSQIAYLSKNIYIEDVRLLSSYSQISETFNKPDDLMLQSFTQQQQIVYEDETLDKIIILYPIVNVQQGQFALYHSHGFIIRFVIEKNVDVQKQLQNIHSNLLNYIQPIIAQILQSGQIQMKQQIALQKISQVLNKRKLQYYRQITEFMCQLQTANVYNFSRSRLYSQIAKSKRFIYFKQELESQNQSQYFDKNQQKFIENQQIQHLIRQAMQIFNRQALKFKHLQFKKFKAGTNKEVYAQVSKKLKKATSILALRMSHTILRSLFIKFAIASQVYRKISHPKTKYIASIPCIFRRFRVTRLRLAFIKLKKNLNHFIRENMKSSQENDKNLFIELNQILLSSYQQKGGLEGGFHYSLGEIFNYLRNQSEKQIFNRDLADASDDFIGHLDEVIITLNSKIFKSGGGQTGNLLNQGDSAQKTRIFICQFNRQALNINQSSLKIIQNNMVDVSQENYLINQIQQMQSQNMPDEEFYMRGDEINNQNQDFQKYMINNKRDLINQMLIKSKGIIFNFQNIQMSLSEIFQSQQSRHKDTNIGNRYKTVQRSKSSLIIPLFDIAQGDIIGSLELYRHHQQVFQEDIEQRFVYFSKRLADFLLLYGQLKAQIFQIEQMKWQMFKSVRPTNSLSQLLKDVFVNAPENHFQGATHVLPIIILKTTFKYYEQSSNQFHNINDPSISQNTNFQEMFSDITGNITPNYVQQSKNSNDFILKQYEKKLAFFFQFKDNFIYNFEYEGTFIDEIMENKCILEVCQKSQLRPDEGLIQDYQLELESSTMSTQSNLKGFADKSIKNLQERVVSITNEQFKHLIYYPIFDIQDDQKILAIFEVGFKKRNKKEQIPIVSQEIQHYLDQFRSQLDQFRIRLTFFCKNLNNLYNLRMEKRFCQMFQTWKQNTIQIRYRQQFAISQNQVLQNQEMCYQDYLKNLENFNYQLNIQSEEKENLKEQVNTFIIEKRAKLKFLATSLISCSNLFKKIENQNKKQAFIKWQYNVSIRKIAEAAFTRVLELNHRHSKARFKAAGYILKSLIKTISIQNAFDSILKTAHMKRMNHRGTRYGYTRDNEDQRSRSKNIYESSNQNVLNNVSCLLSPINMKNIEKKNLYQKQINSFYTPINNDERVFRNNSAIVNPKQVNYIGEQGLNLIQLKPEEVIKDLNTSMKYQTYASTASIADQSKYMNNQKSSLNPSKVNLKKAINKNEQNISRYSNNSVLPISNQKGQKNCSLKVKQKRNNDLSRDYQTEYIINPMEDLDKNLSLSQIEFTAKHKRDYSPIITTSKYDLQKIYDPQKTNKKREKQYNSVNNSHDNYSKNKNIKYHNYTTNKIVDHQQPDKNLELQLQNAQHTKEELKRKLETKQQQLEELRKHLEFGTIENKANKQQRSTSAQQRIKQATNEYTDNLLNHNSYNYQKKQNEFSPPERLMKKQNGDEKIKSKAIQNVQSALYQRYKDFQY